VVRRGDDRLDSLSEERVSELQNLRLSNRLHLTSTRTTTSTSTGTSSTIRVVVLAQEAIQGEMREYRLRGLRMQHNESQEAWEALDKRLRKESLGKRRGPGVPGGVRGRESQVLES
jgi:hypothetical protein